MRSVGPDGWSWIVGALAAGAAAASLWLGSARRSGSDRRGYRWLAGAALLWCAGAIGQQVVSGQPSAPLTLADLLPLVALVPAVVGIVVLAAPVTTATAATARTAAGPPGTGTSHVSARRTELTARQLRGHLADGYVMASSLFVIGWLALFGTQYSKSGEDPRTFLIAMARPLAGVLVVSALLPLVAVAAGGAAVASRAGAGRRALVPYLALFAIIVGESLGTAVRLSGGHEPGGGEQAAKIVGYLLLGAAPWLADQPITDARRGDTIAARLPTGAIVSMLITACAALLLIVTEAAGGSQVEPVVVIVAGGAVLALAGRVLGLLRENRLALDAARVSGGRMRDLADRTSDAVLICDLDGTIRYASPSVAAYGYLTRDIEGRNLADLVHPEDRSAGQRAIRAEAADVGAPSPVARFACRVRAADGTWRHTECTVSRYREPGDRGQLLVTARDVSDQVALRQQVTHLTFHDGLTGLPNRAYFEERVADLLGRRAPGGVRGPDDVAVAAVFVDIDGFTAVNDSAGHAAGDLLLTQAARRLRGVVSAQHTLARWGGDEFAVLVAARVGVKEVVDLAEQLARCIGAEPFRVAGRDVCLTASVGVALAGDSPAGDLMRNADVALSRAKSSGGGRVEIFAAHMHADVVRVLELASDLQRAVANERLAIEYQPIVELATSRITGVEALVRWWRDDDLVPPAEFLPIAEESGLIVPLGDWVLREACGQLARWRHTVADLWVSVNVSARQIGAPGFVAAVLGALASSGLEASALTIEVAEQVLVARGGDLARRLSELRGYGVRIAIDDFGTGYASLGHLRELPVDIIKIDPSFVAGMGSDETLTMLTSTIVRLGHDLGITVVAEGIEHPRQLELLRALGCGCGQGHLIARPAPAPGVESMIRAGMAGHGAVHGAGRGPAPYQATGISSSAYETKS